MQATKKALIQALESNNLAFIASQAKEDRKVMSQLVRLAYDKETLVGWRAIKATGLAARELVKTDYPFLRELIRKLLWSLSDESGGIGWSSPEILGEIVSADPARFQDVIPLIAEVYEIEETVFRPGVLYALCRIAEANYKYVLPEKDLVGRALFDSIPLVRFYGIKLGSLLTPGLAEDDKQVIGKLLKSLVNDHAEIWVYGNNGFDNIQIGEAAVGVQNR
jgi:hypothetical protein